VTAPTSERLEPLVRRLLELLGRITGLESTYLTSIDWEAGVQRILYARNVGAGLEIPEGLTVEWADTLCRRALEGGPTRTDDVAGTYPDSAAAAELGISTYITVPVRAPDGQVLGTVCGADARRVRVDDDALAVMETVADMIALQMETDAVRRELAEANEVLVELAHVDGLTGLGNRRALDRARERLADEQGGSSVIVVDVDRFKQVNDVHGHAAGDEVLRAVADRLRAETRAGDVVVRAGGDEFVVILEGTSGAVAREIADRFCARIGEAPIDVGGSALAVSVSVGVASGDGDVDALVRRADEALYEAKRAGRDGVAGG